MTQPDEDASFWKQRLKYLCTYVLMHTNIPTGSSDFPAGRMQWSPQVAKTSSIEESVRQTEIKCV